MKMLISSLLPMLGLALSTGACSPTDQPVKTEESTPDPTPDPQPTGGRALVVYFSCTNTTKGVADRIVEASDAATWRIEPEVAYTSEDLNYNNSSSRANREQNDPSARPAIKGKCENLADCDVIFLGYPIWWGKAPKVILPSSKAMTSRARPSFRSAPRTPAASGRAIPTCIVWRPEPNGNRGGGSAGTNQKKQLKTGLKV